MERQPKKIAQTLTSIYIDAATKIPFANRLGQPIDPFEDVSGTLGMTRFPGIMTMELSSSIGSDNEAIDAVAAKLYADLRHKVSGATSIEKADYMMYLICSKALVDAVDYLRANYTLMFQYSTFNGYLGKALALARHINYDSISLELENYRGWVNKFISKVNSLNIPKIPFILGGVGKSSIIVADSPDLSRAQLYQFIVTNFYKWDGTTETTGTSCREQKLSAQQYTLAEFAAFFDPIIDAMLLDDDCLAISAWVKNLYGDDVVRLEGIPAAGDNNDLEIKIADKDILTAIENASIIQVDDFTVRQSNNKLQVTGLRHVFSLSSASTRLGILNATKAMLNLHTKTPTSADVVKAMTFVNVPTVISASGEKNLYYPVTGEYVIYKMGVTITPDGAPSDLRFIGSTVNAATVELFDYHPIMKSGSVSSEGSISSMNYHGNIDNYVFINRQSVYNIHQAIWFTLFELKA